MQVRTLCQRAVVTVQRSEEVIRAAQLMREKHVGYLVVVEPDPISGFAQPVGVLTDRDIVVDVIAAEVDPKVVRVGDVMSVNPVTVLESDGPEVALRKMRESGVRRLPVVNGRHELVGVLATDDLLKVIAGDSQDIVGAIRKERQIERAQRQ